MNLEALLRELYGVPERPKPALGQNPFERTKNAEPSLKGESSTVFFSKRFSSAFPGVRRIRWFSKSEEAIERLHILLQQPLVFSDGSPIWWWRSGELQIESFSTLSLDTVLIDEHELVIDEIVAVNAGSYYQQLVYLKTKPSIPSGLYDYSYIQENQKTIGYAREEFAIFNGKFVTRAEYDDGATDIDGKPVSMEGKAQLRIRYLSPYNLIIAPHDSPINNSNFDSQREDLLNEILRGERQLEDFVAAFLKLPKRWIQ
jgi:hypothetical protein